MLRRMHIISKSVYREKSEKYSRRLYEDLNESYGSKAAHRLSARCQVGILTTGSTLFIAKAIAAVLRRFNIVAEIRTSFDRKSYRENGQFFFVLTPMNFTKGLPDEYAVIQMEQTISDRWFTDEYIRTLNNARCVLDYSRVNVDFLNEKKIGNRNLFYAPIAPSPEYDLPIGERTNDVLFYGDDRCGRRQKILTELAALVNLRRAFCVYGEAMMKELDEAKVVVNIHYYEGAMLETTRICEALSHGCIVVSERSINDEEYPELIELVDFVPTGDATALAERCRYWVEHPQEREAKLQEIREKTEKLFLQFCYSIGRVLYYRGLVSFDSLYYVTKDAFRPGKRICLGEVDSVNDSSVLSRAQDAGFLLLPPLRVPKKAGSRIATYAYAARLAADYNMGCVTIMEGNVNLLPDFLHRLEKAEECAEKTDVYVCGSCDDAAAQCAERGVMNPSVAVWSRHSLKRLAYGTKSDALRNESILPWLERTEKDLSIGIADKVCATSPLPLSQKELSPNPKLPDAFTPRISVVVPCYNQENYIRDTLNSVLAQSFLDYEIIVVNDGSTDGSGKVISGYVEQYPDRIRVINIENSGVIEARNTGISQARGKYIFPLDGDDLIHPDCLKKLYVAAEEGKGDVVYSQTEFFGTRTGRFSLPLPTKENMPYKNVVVCSALYRKEDWERYGGYDENCRNGWEDWCFWLNFVADDKIFCRLDETLFYYRRQVISRTVAANKHIDELTAYIRKKFGGLFVNN